MNRLLMNKQKYFSIEYLRIPILYLILGVAWILITDTMALLLNGMQYEIFQTFKGILYVTITAILLYYLIWLQIHKLRDLNLALEDRVEERTAELKRINKEKDDIVDITIHDLKNPLNAIELQADLIITKYDSLDRAEIEHRLNKIILTTRRMSHIITNLLEANAIESGRINVINIETDLVKYLNEIVSIYAYEAEKKNIEVRLQTPENLICIIDVSLLQEILDNLISNAIKFSENNSIIEIAMSATPYELVISIADQGPGFSTRDKAKLFEKYAKLTAKPTAGENSTGLGLFIVKKLVDLLGGEIHLESELGKGAKFILNFTRKV